MLIYYFVKSIDTKICKIHLFCNVLWDYFFCELILLYVSNYCNHSTEMSFSLSYAKLSSGVIECIARAVWA